MDTGQLLIQRDNAGMLGSLNNNIQSPPSVVHKSQAKRVHDPSSTLYSDVIAKSISMFKSGLSSPQPRAQTPNGVPSLVRSPTPSGQKHVRRASSVPRLMFNIPPTSSPPTLPGGNSMGKLFYEQRAAADHGPFVLGPLGTFNSPEGGASITFSSSPSVSQELVFSGLEPAIKQSDAAVKFSKPSLVKPLAISPSRPQGVQKARPMVTATALQFNSPVFESPRGSNGSARSGMTRSPRIKYSQNQKDFLLSKYKVNSKPTPIEQKQIAEEMNEKFPNDPQVDSKNIRVWFTNTRSNMHKGAAGSSSVSPAISLSPSPSPSPSPLPSGSMRGMLLTCNGLDKQVSKSPCASPSFGQEGKRGREDLSSLEPAPKRMTPTPGLACTHVVTPNCTPGRAEFQGDCWILYYNSLAEALRTAGSKDTIVLSAGVYYSSELGEVEKELTIMGTEAGHVIIEDDRMGAPMLVWKAKAGKLCNLTLNQSGLCDTGMVVVESGTLEISNCDFRCGQSGLIVKAGAAVTIKSSFVHNCASSGIIAQNGSSLVVMDSKIFENGSGVGNTNCSYIHGLNGIDIQEGCFVNIRRSQVFGNNGYGVAMEKDLFAAYLVEDKNTVVMEGNEIFDNLGLVLARDGKELTSLDGGSQ